MRRHGLALLLILGIVIAGPSSITGATAAPGASSHAVAPASAGHGVGTAADGPTETTRPDLDCAKPAIVKPNCGVKPQQAGDRGGALQYTIWGLLILGLIVVFAVVFRSAARTNRRKAVEVAGRDWS